MAETHELLRYTIPESRYSEIPLHLAADIYQAINSGSDDDPIAVGMHPTRGWFVIAEGPERQLELLYVERTQG